MDKTLEPSDGNEMTCERCKELEAELHEQTGKNAATVAERAALQEKWQTWDAADLEREIDTLRASNARLREAGVEFAKYLEWVGTEFFPEEKHFKRQLDAFNTALASTPADDLAEYRNGVLEAIEPQLITIEAHGTVLQDEGEFEEYKDRQILGMCLHDAVNAIRAMKANP